jgi:hypothetical protein
MSIHTFPFYYGKLGSWEHGHTREHLNVISYNLWDTSQG